MVIKREYDMSKYEVFCGNAINTARFNTLESMTMLKGVICC